MENHPFNLIHCIEEALDLLAPKAADKKLELAYIIGNKVPTIVNGDVTRLRQIMVNLVGNAVKFTKKGEVVVSVVSQPLGNSRFQVYFAVKDTGIGIPKDHMNRLFKSFSQVDASTTRKFGGTGLGLAISKRLVEMMGGSIWVDSVMGEGSTFHFAIQLTAVSNQPFHDLSGVQPQLDGKRLLIVDDNETNRFILTRQTEAWGIIPRAATSGREALEWIGRGDSFDIAILDMQMPEMDGLTLAVEIRKQKTEIELPLIMLTSLSRDNMDAREAILSAHLTKPVKSSRLFSILTTVLDKQTDRLPLAQPMAENQSQINPHMAELHPLRILLAEDNMINQKVALRLLERLGYKASVAANGLEAIRALQRQPYDVIFMDVQMPEMDGVAATQYIRGNWLEEAQPRIIAMTAHALANDREKYLASGMDDYISKPVRINDLVKALHQCHPKQKCPEPILD